MVLPKFDRRRRKKALIAKANRHPLDPACTRCGAEVEIDIEEISPHHSWVIRFCEHCQYRGVVRWVNLAGHEELDIPAPRQALDDEVERLPE